MSVLKVISPHNGQLIKELPLLNQEKLNSLLKIGDNAQKIAPLTKVQRYDILEKTYAILSTKKDALAFQAAQEGGKPLVDSIVEINRGLEGIKVALQTIATLSGQTIPMGHTPSSQNRLAFTIRESIGLVLAISAFNHPFNLIIHQVIPAIATGCPVIIKPASSTPLSCYTIVEALYEAGLPDSWCQIALCRGKDAEFLVKDKRVKFLTFIGSGEIGWHLKSLLNPGVHCALEHGGVAPSIILDDADIDSIIPSLSKGAFYHAGQVCVSVQRLYVPKRLAGIVAEKVYGHVKDWKNDNPTDIETLIGPLISNSETDRIADWVNQSRPYTEKIWGGNKVSSSHYQATVMLNPSQDTVVSQQEIFGPVLCVYSYDELDEALTRANSLDYSFQASAFGKDIDKLYYCAKRLKATAVMLNDHTAFRVDWMPFGGRKRSGMNMGGIPYTIKDLYEEKLIVLNSPSLIE